MKTLDFKDWLTAMEAAVAANNPNKPLDPTLAPAAKQAQMAALSAVNKNQNPIMAAQKAVLKNGSVPPNQLGKVLPQDPDATDDANSVQGNMKKGMKKK